MPVRDRLRRRQDGAAAVEFALILILFVTLLFGMIQYGFYFYASQTGSSVASEALRQLTVGNCQTQAQLEGLVDDGLGGAKTGDANFTFAADQSNSEYPAGTYPKYYDADGTTPVDSPVVGGIVKLKFSFPTLNLQFPFIPFLNDSTVTKAVTAQVEDDTSSGCE